jgi:hypothetical protein
MAECYCSTLLSPNEEQKLTPRTSTDMVGWNGQVTATVQLISAGVGNMITRTTSHGYPSDPTLPIKTTRPTLMTGKKLLTPGMATGTSTALYQRASHGRNSYIPPFSMPVSVRWAWLHWPNCLRSSLYLPALESFLQPVSLSML